MSTHTTTPTEITFETGYRRLQQIAERVGSEEVPVHEMCDLFAEGRGLDHALTGYLAEQKTRVEAIENGEGIQAFRIVAPAADTAADDSDFAPGARGDVPVNTADFAPAAAPTPRPVAPADDDIPF
jgi:exonuclease VII small subunit